MLERYEALAKRVLVRPGFTAAVILGGVALVIACLFPFLGRAYFPRTDPGQFVINVRMPSGTRLEDSNRYIAKVEKIIRETVRPKDLGMIVSNIGVYPDLSAIYTTNASMDTAFVQTSLKEDHSLGSYEYMARVRERLSREMPELTTYFQAGGLVDSVINQGLPAPIDVQVSSNDMDGAFKLAKQLSQKIKAMPNVSDVYIPQDLNYPGLALNIDRERASLIGLSAKNVVDNVITALTSDGMIAPSYWIDPKTGNNYMVTVQYANRVINHMTMEDFENIPLRGARPTGYDPMQEGREASDVGGNLFYGGHTSGYTPLRSVAEIKQINTPTEVDHYQIRRVIDIYVATKTEALEKVGKNITTLIANTKTDRNTRAHDAGGGGEHERILPGFWSWLADLDCACVSHPDGAVHVVHRSLHHPHGDSAGACGGGDDPAVHREHAQHHVLDGGHHDDWDRCFQQHPHCGVLRHSARGRASLARGHGASVQGAFAAYPHDLSGHVAGHDPNGFGT